MDRQPDTRKTDPEEIRDIDNNVGSGRAQDISQEDAVPPPIIKPGDHRNPEDPDLPLVSPIVDGGNL